MSPNGITRLLAVIVLTTLGTRANPTDPMPTYGLAIHGGAGVILRADMSAELEAEYRATLAAALEAGYAILERGGSAIDAVTAALVLLEDSPHFNAGRGAVLNADGQCELDAAIMEGRHRTAGAVAGVQRVKNPILLARDVMLKSPHVMLTGAGADNFAIAHGHIPVPNEYFQTERRKAQLQKARELEAKDHPTAFLEEKVRLDPAGSDRKFGTVGCVALDRGGNLAAGTSTGGMTNKRFGRVGDSPIIGAGTYADNGTCAVSATGHGEYFIRHVAAHDVAAHMRYGGATLAAAAADAIAGIARAGGTGGLIAMDAAGNVTMPFNTAGMYRGYRKSTGETAVEIFGADAR